MSIILPRLPRLYMKPLGVNFNLQETLLFFCTNSHVDLMFNSVEHQMIAYITLEDKQLTAKINMKIELAFIPVAYLNLQLQY